MIDLPGGKPRFCNLEPVEISSTREYALAFGTTSGSGLELQVSPPLSLDECTVGRRFVVGDGENEFRLIRSEAGVGWGRFRMAGVLERQRALLSTARSSRIEMFTENDRTCLREARPSNFDWVAFSFAESGADIVSAREWLNAELAWRPRIVAKIETAVGVTRIAEIAAASDVVMVARGDLALSCELGLLWHAQKRVIDECRRLNKYVIVATEFLESLGRRLAPTRPEIMDVCSALSMGVDAVMLTVETAIGPRPVEAVAILRRIEESWRLRGEFSGFF
jgi:Pyruvate kinase